MLHVIDYYHHIFIPLVLFLTMDSIMFQFFLEKPIGDVARLMAPNYNTINAMVLKQRNAILDRYNRGPMAMLNNRQLDRLIASFTTPVTNNWEQYYAKLKVDANRHASVVGIVSPTHMAKITNRPFFSSEGIFEVTVAVEYPWSAKDHYSDIRAVRWLYHESTNLHMPVYNRQNIQDYSDTGVWVVGVDVPLLMVQYHKWRYASNEGDSIDRFIASAVLPGMIDSHFGLAILNRLRLLVEGKVPGYSYNPHQSAYPNLDKGVDDILKYYIKGLENKNSLKYHQMLSALPGFILPTFWDIAQIPNSTGSNLSNWARDLARFSLVSFLLRFMNDTDNHANREFINKCTLYNRQLKQTNVLKLGLGSQYERLKRWMSYNIEPFI